MSSLLKYTVQNNIAKKLQITNKIQTCENEMGIISKNKLSNNKKIIITNMNNFASKKKIRTDIQKMKIHILEYHMTRSNFTEYLLKNIRYIDISIDSKRTPSFFNLYVKIPRNKLTYNNDNTTSQNLLKY